MILLDINKLCVSYFSSSISQSAAPSFINFEKKVIKNFTARINSGDRVAVIGPNGSGKTTLLKAIAGHISATSGSIKIHGKLTAQLSISSGLNVNLTGRENFRLKCIYHRIPGSQSDQLLEPLITKLGLETYIDDLVSTYSSGTRAKLVTTFLTIPRGDILILDEWVGAADLAKGNISQAFREILFNSNRGVLFSSHSPSIIKQWATKVWVVTEGELVFEGTPETGISHLKSLG